WRDLGHKFCVRVREYTRVEPAQLTPDELSDEDFAGYHLVLFGSILDNPAVLKLYARGRCFTDASYPGRDGAEIRTLVNPLGTGRDILHIGGSDISSVHEAAIGLNRTFLDVTTEVDGVLYLRRLNFCVAPDHHVAVPEPASVRRELDLAGGEPNALAALAATFALCHYQTDHPGWADAVRGALAPVIDATPGPHAASRLALAWGLTHAFSGYDEEFRAGVDAMLTRTGRAAAATLRAEDTAAPLSAVVSDCMTVIRVSDHLESAHGAPALTEDAARAWQKLLRPDPGVAEDGLRDWPTVDGWLAAVLRCERYDLLDGGILDELTCEAVAERDNLGVPIGDASGGEHAENVLRKIAAYQDAGEPLWLRRWMQGSAPQPAGGRVPSGWYTGAYAPERAPTPARDIPRIHVAPTDGEHGDVRSVVARRDLDGATEYLALAGPTLRARRLTWKGHAWLTEEHTSADTTDGPVSVADMDGFGYVSAAARSAECDESRRQILWRHGEFFLLVDTGREHGATDAMTPADGVSKEATAGGHILRAGMSAIGVTSSCDEASSLSRATLISLGGAAQLAALDSVGYAAGGATCYVGGADVAGSLLVSEAGVFDGDDIWLAGFRSLRSDGCGCLTASSAVHLHLSRSRATGRATADTACRLAWNDGADGVDLASGSYDVQLHDFDWTSLDRLATR
ncbi:hypothetical protein HOI71_15090, partial [Candidatus Poribacteria bacterium]|nr:hypothetical protein [Candidatus Poribacteria bacterium]